MEDKQKKYLDKVVEFLHRDTKIDYDKEEIQFPSPRLTLSFLSFSSFFDPSLSSFPKYCKNVYGLTDQELEYVWGKYKTIVLNKINNGR